MEHSREITAHNPIRVMIFDSTRMGCQLLSRMLESSPYHVRVIAASEHPTVSPDLPLGEADIALVSVNAADGPGKRFKLLREIRQSQPSVRCVMLLDECDREQVIEAFSSGVMGVCGRHESCEVLCKCIDRVFHGQIWANSEQLHYVLETLCTGNRVRLTDARGNGLLTRREEEIVYLVAEGLRNKEIAEQLKLSEHTIRNYLFRIFEKLGISSRSELILYTLQQRRKTESS
ncbi:MAG: response regulator transcription factor [Candidatus Korobacteraceae bacterium]